LLQVNLDNQGIDGSIKLRFSVKDTGIGIPADKQDILFKAFSQVDGSSTRRYGGNGLGLVISKHLVELMGGSIAVESEEGKGSTFRFTIKLEKYIAPVSAVEILKQPEKPLDCCSEDAAGYAHRILLAEDNLINRKLAVKLLQKKGYRVDAVVNGLEAVKAFAAKSYDLILMDVHMPEMDGYEAVKEIRKKEKGKGNAHIPVIAMTADALREDREKCFAAGMDDYLSKPIKPELFFETIAGWLKSV
jgi:CheY-like chemotaxis protein